MFASRLFSQGIECDVWLSEADLCFLLCSVVGDLMKNVNHKAQSTLELEKYLNRPQSKRMQVCTIARQPKT